VFGQGAAFGVKNLEGSRLHKAQQFLFLKILINFFLDDNLVGNFQVVKVPLDSLESKFHLLEASLEPVHAGFLRAGEELKKGLQCA